MAGPIGTPMATPLPTVLVDDDATGESKFVTRNVEIQGYLEQKITNTSLNITDADIRHGARTVYLSAIAGVPTSGTAAPNTATDFFWNSTGVATIVLNLPFDANRRIATVNMYGRANATNSWTFQLYKFNMTTGVATQLGTTQTSTITASPSTLTVTGLTETTVAATVYYGIWTSGGTNCRFYGASFTYDKIAVP